MRKKETGTMKNYVLRVLSQKQQYAQLWRPALAQASASPEESPISLSHLGERTHLKHVCVNFCLKIPLFSTTMVKQGEAVFMQWCE